MRRLSITSLAATAVGVLVLAALLLSWGSSENKTEAVFGVVDCTPSAVICEVHLDMDGTTAIPVIESSNTATTAPTSIFVDVSFDEVDVLGVGMGAWGFNILMDPSIAYLKSYSTALTTVGGPTMIPACFQVVPLVAPDFSGNSRIDCGAIGAAVTGEGVVMAFEVECLAAGQTLIDITNFSNKNAPGAPLPVALDFDGQLGCDGPAASQIDPEITSETIAGPGTLALNTVGLYTDSKTIDSDSATAVAVTIATSIIPPADCTTYADAGVDADPIDSSTVAITGVSAASPAVVTAAGHGLSTGDYVVISGTAGTLTGAGDPGVNHVHVATVIDGSTFTIPVTNYSAVGAGGTAARVIGTTVAALTSAGATPAVTFDAECSQPSFHNIEVTNEIYLDAPKLYGPDPTGNNVIAHTNVPAAGSGGSLGVLVTSAASPHDMIEVAITASADADFGTVTVDASNLTDTDNGVAGAELKKGETVTINIDKDITLVSSDVLPVTFNLSTAVTTPAGCTTTLGQSDPVAVVFAALGTINVPLSYDISCTVPGVVGLGWIKNWDFDETLTSDDAHIVDGDTDTNHEDLDIPVIEDFVPSMNVDQSSTDNPATTAVVPGALGQCLTTLGCEQVYYDSMGPGDPFASVMYVDFPKASPGYTIAAAAAVANGTVVGELLGTTTINWDGGSGCGSPSTATVLGIAGGTVDLTNVDPVSPPAGAPAGAIAQYEAIVGSFAGAGMPLHIDILVYDMGTSYRQYRVASGVGSHAGTGTLGGDWSLTVCNGNIDYDLLGLVGAGPTNIRSCDDPGTHTFDSLWTRDDTGGTYTATEDLECAAADVSVVLVKDEIIGDDVAGGDIVDQGVATTRDVTITVAGPPDTILTVSLTGPAACDPRWVSPLDPAPSVLGGIQTSVVTVDPAGAGAQIFTYQVTCDPAGIYNLQIVANVTSVSAGAEANLLNNQAENIVQVIALADSDGDGVPTPQDNCPNIPNPNQNDADSDGEGNPCDQNDDDDCLAVQGNPAPPPNAYGCAVPIMDNPIAIPLGGPYYAGPDQCNPGLDLYMSGPDLDALSAAELALWQEDYDGDDTYMNMNFALDLDGCADTDMSVDVVKDEEFDVNVSEATPKTVTITVTNGNAAVGDATVNLLALSRVGKCEVRWVAEAGDLSSEFQTDEITLFTVDGPGGADDYAPTPDGALDTLHSQLEVSTGPMAAGEVLVLTRDYTIHCYQPSTQLWWDSTPDGDYNFDSTMEIQIDVLPDAPVVEEDLADNVHKNFPLVTANAVVDLKYSFTVIGPTEVPLGVSVDVEGFSTIHNNGPSPTDAFIYGGFVTPPGCSLSLISGAILIPPNVATGILPVSLFGPFGVIPPSVEIVMPLSPGSTAIICMEPSFHTLETTLIMEPAWPNQSGAEPETGEDCQNFVDDDGDGVTNDGCPNHLVDPNPDNNLTVFYNNVAAIGATTLNVDVEIVNPPTGEVSVDEFFPVTKTFSQQIDPFWNPFSLLGEDGVPAAGPSEPNPFGYFPCADGADNGPDGDGADAGDADDCNIYNLPNSPIFPLITETMNPPDDCAIDYHITNDFLSRIIGGAAGLTITVNGVVQSPPTPAGWEASDVVLGLPGEDVSIDFQIQVTGGQWYEAAPGVWIPIPAAPTVITEDWTKHCYAPSTHQFALNTTWASSGMDDPHLPYDGDTRVDEFSENIYAYSDLKIVTDFFTDLTDLGGNNWLGTVVPGVELEGHQKEALHNNGPYGPVAATVTIVATASAGCGVSYDVRGDEISVNGGVYAPGTQVPDDAGVLTVIFPAILPDSVDVWFAELWRFSATEDCTVTIEKTVTPDDIHIIDIDGAVWTKTVEICIDTDGDGVHDSGDGNCNGPDNCPDVWNPDQLDTDGDGLGDVCDPDPNRPPHDGVVKYVITIGPAAINLSDTTGRYMWIIAEVGNQGGPPVTETATVDLTIAEGVPAGCDRTPLDDDPADGILNEALVLPGQDTFTLLGLEQKFLVWRLRYECHEPAVTSTFDQTVTVTITIANDGNPANDSQTVVKTVIIH